MKKFGLKRLKGIGCNSSFVKSVVSDWKKRYDRSNDYHLRTAPRVKQEKFSIEDLNEV